MFQNFFYPVLTGTLIEYSPDLNLLPCQFVSYKKINLFSYWTSNGRLVLASHNSKLQVSVELNCRHGEYKSPQ